jgi:hypothetical protein
VGDFFPTCLFVVLSHENDYIMVQGYDSNGYMDYVDLLLMAMVRPSII